MARLTTAICAVLCFLGIAWPNAVVGQTAYPEGTVRFVVAYGAGGPTDIFARYVARELSELWGKAVVVENRPGAVGTLAQRAVAIAKPDGYTLLFGTAMGAPLLADLPPDQIPGLDQFEPIVQTGVTAMHIAVRSDLNINSVSDLVDYARRNPGVLRYSVSVGSPPYMAFERFRNAAGIKMLAVPLPGSAAQINGLLSNTVQLSTLDTQSAVTAEQTGAIKAIALIGNWRAEHFPNVPSLSEQGYPNISVVPWYGLLGPKGLPASIRDKIATDVLTVMRRENVIDQLRKMGFEARVGGPDVLLATVTEEIDGTRKGIAELGSILQK